MEPFITIILPIRNEAAYITRALGAVLAQDYPSDRMEVLVVDGQSTDDTREVIADYLAQARSPIPVRILDNPGRIVPIAMNIATREARGDVIVRVDGHCVIAKDYVRRCVDHLQNEAVDGVGGPMESVGEGYIGQAAAFGMSSSFGVGNSAFRTTTGVSKLVDTIPFPAYTRQIVERAGLYDEEMVRSQDSEYNYRIRELGGRLLLAEDVHSIYYSRSSLRQLWKQYFDYGCWKLRVLQKHPAQLSFRQLIPPLFIITLLACMVWGLSLLISRLSGDSILPVLFFFSILPGLLYGFADLLASILTARRHGWKYLPIMPLVFAILHFAFGVGFLAGLVRFVNRWGDRRGNVPEWLPAWTQQAHRLVPPHPGRLGGTPGLLLKRAFDIVVSFISLLVLGPVFGFLALRIRNESPGPILQRLRRVGRNGKLFNVLRFRTVNVDSEQGSAINGMLHEKGVPTAFGQWLRATKLNELPQLWNVLKGEMSLVGPRPWEVDVVHTWPVEARMDVLSVRPGITSPAAIMYYREESRNRASDLLGDYMKSVVPLKLRLDQLYVRHRNFLGDLDLIFTTMAFSPFRKHFDSQSQQRPDNAC